MVATGLARALRKTGARHRQARALSNWPSADPSASGQGLGCGVLGFGVKGQLLFPLRFPTVVLGHAANIGYLRREKLIKEQELPCRCYRRGQVVARMIPE